MRAMLLDAPGTPLRPAELPSPEPAPGQVLIRVSVCAVCRTDLHVLDGELPHPKLPLVMGHEIVGEVVATGPGVTQHRVGTRVGVPWLGYTCGKCRYCVTGRENLCAQARFTGISLMVATRSSVSRMSGIAFPSRRATRTCRRRRCCARG